MYFLSNSEADGCSITELTEIRAGMSGLSTKQEHCLRGLLCHFPAGHQACTFYLLLRECLIIHVHFFLLLYLLTAVTVTLACLQTSLVLPL